MIPWYVSDRATSVYAVVWCVGFGPACAGAYWHLTVVKWAGMALMAPFSVYVAVMAVLSAVALMRAIRRGEM